MKQNIGENNPSFSIEFIHLCNLVCRVIRLELTLMLLGYPIGLHPIRSFNERGMILTKTGLLKEKDVAFIKILLNKDEVLALEELGDNDEEVKNLVEKTKIIAEEEMKVSDKQIREWEEFFLLYLRKYEPNLDRLDVLYD